MRVVENEGSVLPGRGRFHTTPDNRLFVLYFVEGSDGFGDEVKENRLIEIYSDHTISKYLKVELTNPIATFFTTSARSGSAPSEVIDILGDDGNQNMRYARIRLHPD